MVENNEVISILSLGLTNRIANTLMDNGIYTLDYLLQYTKGELLEMHGLGVGGVKDVQNALSKIGLELSEAVTSKNKANVQSYDHNGITSAGFSARTTNALINGGINSVGDLMRCSRNDLLEMRGLGTKCLKEIMSYLTKIENCESIFSASEEQVSLGDFWAGLKQKDRNQQCLVEYYNGGYKVTYEVISQKYGVSRERIRQIIAKGLKKIRSAFERGAIKTDIIHIISEAADKRTEINTVDVSDGVFSNAGAVRLLAAVFPDEIKIIKHNSLNGEWLTRKNDNVDTALQKLIGDLNYRPNPISVNEVVSIYGINEDMLMSINSIIEKDGYVTSSKNKKATGTDRYTIISDYLRSINRPASIQEISDRTSLSLNQVRGAIDHNKSDFINVGQSIYDLIDADYSGKTIEMIAKKILVAEGKALKVDRVVSYVKRYLDESNERIIRTILCSTLLKHNDSYILLSEWGDDKIKHFKPKSYAISIWDAIQTIINNSNEIFDAEKMSEAIKAKFGDSVSDNTNSIRAALIKLADSGLIRKAGANTGCYVRLNDQGQAEGDVVTLDDDSIKEAKRLYDFVEDNIGSEVEIKYKTKRSNSDKHWRAIIIDHQDTTYIYTKELLPNGFPVRFIKKRIIEYRKASN